MFRHLDCLLEQSVLLVFLLLGGLLHHLHHLLPLLNFVLDLLHTVWHFHLSHRGDFRWFQLFRLFMFDFLFFNFFILLTKLFVFFCQLAILDFQTFFAAIGRKHIKPQWLNFFYSILISLFIQVLLQLAHRFWNWLHQCVNEAWFRVRPSLNDWFGGVTLGNRG